MWLGDKRRGGDQTQWQHGSQELWKEEWLGGMVRGGGWGGGVGCVWGCGGGGGGLDRWVSGVVRAWGAKGLGGCWGESGGGGVWSQTEKNTYPQFDLQEPTWSANFEATLSQLWANFEPTLSQLWANFEPKWAQLWAKMSQREQKKTPKRAKAEPTSSRLWPNFEPTQRFRARRQNWRLGRSWRFQSWPLPPEAQPPCPWSWSCIRSPGGPDLNLRAWWKWEYCGVQNYSVSGFIIFELFTVIFFFFQDWAGWGIFTVIPGNPRRTKGDKQHLEARPELQDWPRSELFTVKKPGTGPFSNYLGNNFELYSNRLENEGKTD